MKLRFDSTSALFLFIGIPFIIAGIIVGLLVPRAFASQRADVASLTPLTLDEIRQTAAGTRILVEGTVSPDMAEQDVGLVAYTLYRNDESSEGDELKLVERVTPPLTLQVSTGLVHISNDGYEIRSISQSVTKGSLHYSGLGRHDALFAVGTLLEAGQTPMVTADFVSAGTQADFIAEQNLLIGGWWLFACIFVLIGFGLLATAVFLAMR